MSTETIIERPALKLDETNTPISEEEEAREFIGKLREIGQDLPSIRPLHEQPLHPAPPYA
jgi:hypothetical protein